MQLKIIAEKLRTGVGVIEISHAKFYRDTVKVLFSGTGPKYD
jgi:hypothetical protein